MSLNVMKYVPPSFSQCGRRPRSRIVTSPKRGRDAPATAGGAPALLVRECQRRGRFFSLPQPPDLLHVMEAVDQVKLSPLGGGVFSRIWSSPSVTGEGIT